MNETIKTPRREYSRYFGRNTRTNGDDFTFLTEENPKELQDLIQEIHKNEFEDCLPNDWIYETVRRAFDELSDEGYDIDDLNIESDPYYHSLLEWLNNPYSAGFCNEAACDGLTDGKDIYVTIGWGQMLAMERIYRAVNDFIQEEADNE